MKLNKYKLLVFFVLLNLTSWGQANQLIKSKIEFALISYYNAEGSEVSELPQYRNKAFVFGFSIFTNQQGKIDSITFTNKSKTLDSLISFRNIERRLREQESAFSTLKNRILVGIALVRNHEDLKIDNFYDGVIRRSNSELFDFDTGFYNMLPKTAEKDFRKIYLLPAFSLVQVRGKP